MSDETVSVSEWVSQAKSRDWVTDISPLHRNSRYLYIRQSYMSKGISYSDADKVADERLLSLTILEAVLEPHQPTGNRPTDRIMGLGGEVCRQCMVRWPCQVVYTAAQVLEKGLPDE